tara:strand:- start:139 stop:363 length:225 start_codon:yes stop_codon:yes gene_type:complete
MNLDKAFKIVLDQAETSTHKEAVVCGKTLKAIETLKNFYKQYGHFFSKYDHNGTTNHKWDEEIMERLYIDDDNS